MYIHVYRQILGPNSTKRQLWCKHSPSNKFGRLPRTNHQGSQLSSHPVAGQRRAPEQRVGVFVSLNIPAFVYINTLLFNTFNKCQIRIWILTEIFNSKNYCLFCITTFNSPLRQATAAQIGNDEDRVVPVKFGRAGDQ